MRPELYVYHYDNEPSDERPTGFGETNFGHSGIAAVSTIAAVWTMSQHSTFDEPSRSTHRVQAYRKYSTRRRAGLIGVVLLALAVVSSALALALHS